MFNSFLGPSQITSVSASKVFYNVSKWVLSEKMHNSLFIYRSTYSNQINDIRTHIDCHGKMMFPVIIYLQNLTIFIAKRRQAAHFVSTLLIEISQLCRTPERSTFDFHLVIAACSRRSTLFCTKTIGMDPHSSSTLFHRPMDYQSRQDKSKRQRVRDLS